MKKQLCLLLLLLIGCNAVYAQRVVENPAYEFTKSGIIKITKVELNTDNTKLHLRYSCSPGLWITVDSTVTIKNSTGDEVYPILDVEGIEFGEQVYMTESRYHDLVVTFGAIDPDIKEIDYISKRWSSILGVKLTEQKNSFPALIHGNWSDVTGEKGWTYGFYPSVAIIGHEFWTYNEIKKSRKGYDLTLQCGDRTKELFITRKDTLLAIGESKKEQSLYTRGTQITNPVEVEELSIEPFKSGEMVLQGFIEGYSPKADIKTGLVYVRDVINNEDIQTLIEIQPDGHFSAKLKLAQAGQFFFIINNHFVGFLGVPNDTLTVYLDWNVLIGSRWNRDDRYYGSELRRYMGRAGRLNAELQAMEQFTSYDFMKYYNKNRELEFQPLYDLTIKDFKQDSIELETQLTKHNTLPLTKKLARTGLVASYVDGFISSTWGKLKRKSETVGDCNKSYQDCSVLPVGYFELLKYLDVSDSEIVLVMSFESLINRYEFAPFFAYYNAAGVNTANILDYINQHGKLSDTEKEAISKNKLVADLDSTQRADNQKQIGDILNRNMKLYQEYMAPFQLPARKKAWAEMDSISKTFWSDTDNILQQIALRNKWKFELDNADIELGEKLTTLAKEYVTIPFLRENMDKVFYNKYHAKGSTEIPEGVGKELFQKLIAPHKGKSILIDFWATSCGPCIMSIRNTHDLRKRLADKNVVFMFITSDKDSPLEPYNKIMNDVVGGDKHRLSGDDYNKLKALFNVNAIPRYILMDAEGKVVDDNIRSCDFEGELKRLLGVVEE